MRDSLNSCGLARLFSGFASLWAVGKRDSQTDVMIYKSSMSGRTTFSLRPITALEHFKVL